MDGPRKILVVEDSPTMVQLYRVVLDDRVLLFARDGLEGLELAAKHEDVDLFIVDINMPRMDGMEFLRKLRGELGVRDVPAIVISSEAEDADEAEARDAGANAYLRKPWRPDELRRAMMETWQPGGAEGR
jgi:CheY-like chemotaxis protein